MNEGKAAPGLGLAEDMLELTAVETAEARFLLMWLRERLPANALFVLLGWTPVFDNNGALAPNQHLRFGDLQRLRRARKDHILAQPRAELEVAELAEEPELGESYSALKVGEGRMCADPLALLRAWQKEVFATADKLEREATRSRLPNVFRQALLELVKKTHEFARQGD